MLILASSSPRRAKLLSDIGLEFIVEPSHINEEEIDSKLKPTELAIELAKLKALHVAKNCS